jgi:YegS/Rv2252/BmrU family lipid kinase
MLYVIKKLSRMVDRVLILNPNSGNGQHVSHVRDLASENGFEVKETREKGDGTRLTEEAVENDAEIIAAAGGDGTANEVVDGICKADGLDQITLLPVPAGTGNNFAGNIGVKSIEHSFELLEDGERRRIDLGLFQTQGYERVFVNSCVSGLTAEASAETSSEAKKKFGVMAYVLTALQKMADFKGMQLHIDIYSEAEEWHGDAVLILVGNGRKFSALRQKQANMEDGLLDIAILENNPKISLAGETLAKEIIKGDTFSIKQLKASSISLSVLNDPVRFSLDGEMIETKEIEINTLPQRLNIIVGDSYDPEPDKNNSLL